eukprot:CAMPEP_0178925730 /NCGR_PEP_ID=MMETSP0786-20121207/18087_1 /TAXON_ID=186022 /ORGANISM="Thalassionema frauenfeldii, Strain CCMP 1798" /LENGTH=235 /DNA_ID=CAMNT_0020600669 /DNA_START=306 /DNA_END=1010 /DNA_ORIENTATION=-
MPTKDNITFQRAEASGRGWQEHFVDQNRASKSSCVGSSVSQSLSYVTIENFASDEERRVLQRSATNFKNQLIGNENCSTHVLGATEAAHHNCTRFSVEGLLDSNAKTVSATFLDRLLGFLEGNGSWGGHDKIDEMSVLAGHVFGSSNGLKDLEATWYQEPDENGKMHPEPKVNIYEDGGYFKAHEDGMNLTLLVVLNDAFEGGGTAFFCEDNDMLSNKKNADRICDPEAGTAIIW